MSTTEEPRIERSLVLRFCGDLGQANMHRICGWLAWEACDRAGRHSRSVIHSGTGFVDNVLKVAYGDVDVAITTPSCFAVTAMRGVGPYGGQALGDLRALGTIAHRDALVFAVDPSLGVDGVAALRDGEVPLRIAASVDEGDHMAFASAEVLRASGIAPDALVPYRFPEQGVRLLRDGKANAVLFEAIMRPWWRDYAAERPMRLLSLEDPALTELERVYGWPSITIEAGYFPGQDAPLTTIDFSGLLVLVRSDLPDDVAELLTWCMVHARARFEAGYAHFPQGRSPVTVPLDPAEMADAPIPLHPASERVYAAVLGDDSEGEMS